MNDLFWMKRVLLLSKKAFLLTEIPISSIIIEDNFEISSGINLTCFNFGTVNHSEINALNQSIFYFANKKIKDFSLYTTLEPCDICLSILIRCNINKIVFSLYQKKIFKYNTAIKIKGGILDIEFKKLINKYFYFKRINNRHYL
jgi:tRNA(adenine34) deaminase